LIRTACACLLVLAALVAPAASARAADSTVEAALPAAAAPTVKAAPPGAAAPPDSLNADWSLVPEYRLVPGDQLILNFGPSVAPGGGFLERPVIVRPDGRISIFPAGDVVAAGHTPRELEATLVDLLSASVKQPRVTVEVTKIAGNQVHVLGQVERPGSYPAEPFVTVVQAITAAGGFSDDAARNSVLVFHRIGSREVSVAVLHLDKMIKHGSLQADLPLSRFDVVYVPRNMAGNFSVFSAKVLGPITTALAGTLIGWELFNLDRVFGIPIDLTK
jgi:polysaccharide export outer membrane protein